mmetsp:Transcript_28389/g.77737  ORF Transcript_28389/g.77737 Transcript_28389/m.77737 type:complete len:503 (+) Transcript_28389:472-1980(+)
MAHTPDPMRTSRVRRARHCYLLPRHGALTTRRLRIRPKPHRGACSHVDLTCVERVEELFRVVRRVVVHNLLGVDLGDGAHKVAQLGAGLWLQLEHFLQPPRHHKRATRGDIMRKHLGKLLHDIGEDGLRRVVEEWLERRQVDALLDDRFERALRLGLEVLRGCLVQIDSEQLWQRVGIGEGFGVVGRVAANLTERPSGCRLDVILGLGHDGVDQRRDALGDDHRESQRLGESRDVAERHDAGEGGVATRLGDVVDKRANTARVDDELGKLWRVLGDLADARRSVLPHVHVNILEQVEDLWEDLRLNHHLCQVDRVLADLRQARADLPLELAVGREDERGNVRDGATVDDRLGKLGRVLAYIRERGSRDALEGQLGLLHAEHKQRHCARVNDRLRKLSVVSRDVSESPCGRLLDARVELLKASDQRVERTRVDNRLRELRRVLRDGSQDERRRLLVEAVLLGEGVDELRQHLVRDDRLSELVVVVGEAPERERCGLLDGRDVV